MGLQLAEDRSCCLTAFQICFRARMEHGVCYMLEDGPRIPMKALVRKSWAFAGRHSRYFNRVGRASSLDLIGTCFFKAVLEETWPFLQHYGA